MSGPMAYDTIHNNYEDGVGGGHVLEVNSGGVAGGISGNSGPALGGVKQGGYYSEGYGSGYTLDPTKPRDGLITSFPAICGKIVEAYTTIRKRPYPKKSKVFIATLFLQALIMLIDKLVVHPFVSVNRSWLAFLTITNFFFVFYFGYTAIRSESHIKLHCFMVMEAVAGLLAIFEYTWNEHEPYDNSSEGLSIFFLILHVLLFSAYFVMMLVVKDDFGWGHYHSFGADISVMRALTRTQSVVEILKVDLNLNFLFYFTATYYAAGNGLESTTAFAALGLIGVFVHFIVARALLVHEHKCFRPLIMVGGIFGPIIGLIQYLIAFTDIQRAEGEVSIYGKIVTFGSFSLASRVAVLVAGYFLLPYFGTGQVRKLSYPVIFIISRTIERHLQFINSGNVMLTIVTDSVVTNGAGSDFQTYGSGEVFNSDDTFGQSEEQSASAVSTHNQQVTGGLYGNQSHGQFGYTTGVVNSSGSNGSGESQYIPPAAVVPSSSAFSSNINLGDLAQTSTSHLNTPATTTGETEDDEEESHVFIRTAKSDVGSTIGNGEDTSVDIGLNALTFGFNNTGSSSSSGGSHDSARSARLATKSATPKGKASKGLIGLAFADDMGTSSHEVVGSMFGTTSSTTHEEGKSTSSGKAPVRRGLTHMQINKMNTMNLSKLSAGDVLQALMNGGEGTAPTGPIEPVPSPTNIVLHNHDDVDAGIVDASRGAGIVGEETGGLVGNISFSYVGGVDNDDDDQMAVALNTSQSFSRLQPDSPSSAVPVAFDGSKSTTGSKTQATPLSTMREIDEVPTTANRYSAGDNGQEAAALLTAMNQTDDTETGEATVSIKFATEDDADS